MARTASLLLTALAFLTIAATAQARDADGQLWSATNVAQAYWNSPTRAADVQALAEARGVAPCEVVTPSIAPPPVPKDYVEGEVKASSAYGWSAIGSCAFALTPHFAAETRRARGWWTRFDLKLECATVVHEGGHARGLVHEDAARFPIMAEGHPDDSAIPRRCGAWAGRIMREWRASLASRRVRR